MAEREFRNIAGKQVDEEGWSSWDLRWRLIVFFFAERDDAAAAWVDGWTVKNVMGAFYDPKSCTQYFLYSCAELPRENFWETFENLTQECSVDGEKKINDYLRRRGRPLDPGQNQLAKNHNEAYGRKHGRPWLGEGEHMTVSEGAQATLWFL